MEVNVELDRLNKILYRNKNNYGQGSLFMAVK